MLAVTNNVNVKTPFLSLNKLIEVKHVMLYVLLNFIVDVIQIIIFDILMEIRTRPFTKYELIFIILMIIPPIFMSIIIAYISLQNSPRNNRHQSINCIGKCIKFVTIMSMSQCLMLILPYFYSTTWGGCGRILVDRRIKSSKYKSRNEYFEQILKYCINDNNDIETKKRIIAANYYLHCIIDDYQYVSSEYQNGKTKYLQKTAELHGNGYKQYGKKLTNIEWEVIIEDTLRCNQSTLRMNICHILYIVTLMENIIIYLYICSLWKPFIAIFCVIFMLQWLNCKLHYKYHKIEFYINYIMPTLQVHKMRYQISWEKLPWTKKIIDDIETIYEIMFDQTEQILIIYESMGNNDIAGIVAQYIWFPLPNHSDMSQQLHIFRKEMSIYTQLNTAQNFY